jgi:hypothetical protein
VITHSNYTSHIKTYTWFGTWETPTVTSPKSTKMTQKTAHQLEGQFVKTQTSWGIKVILKWHINQVNQEYFFEA